MHHIKLIEEGNEILENLIIADVNSLPASKSKLDEYRESDPICSAVIKFCKTSCRPPKERVERALIPYWNKQGEFTICAGLLLLGKRIVIPRCKQHETLLKIHEGHQGILRCRMRAQSAVWWPGMQHEIANFVKQCKECAKEQSPRREPLITTDLPLYPWQWQPIYLSLKESTTS